MSLYMECDESGCTQRAVVDRFTARPVVFGWVSHSSPILGEPMKDYCPEHYREWKP